MIRFLVLLLVLASAHAASADTITIGKVTRHYTARLPDTRPAPLVIVLHGNTQTDADMITRTAWPAVAKREGFGVVFPNGLNHAWADLRPVNLRAGRVPPRGTDDVAFIAKLVEKLVADGSADPKRIYITGISSGGAMIMTLVCKRADLFAAAATVVINLTDQAANPCRPPRAMPMLMMNGTADPLVPYKGGRGTSRFAVDGFWSVEKTLSFWRRNNGCEAKDAAVTDLDDTDRSDRSTVTRIDSKCRPDATSCSTASMTAAIACPARSTPDFPDSPIRFLVPRTATSTAPRRSGRSSRSFREACLDHPHARERTAYYDALSSHTKRL